MISLSGRYEYSYSYSYSYSAHPKSQPGANCKEHEFMSGYTRERFRASPAKRKSFDEDALKSPIELH